ncbi:glycosyltransferase [Salinimicrobium sp. HB62]|uniref:glycosyltransferase n=1 Tax=Salinimicrobium sp. HB62 TaxID=3077781 RepID=UPI002D79395E|nr:glycosyltransferase [Salinimicrobium sp. HB62]
MRIMYSHLGREGKDGWGRSFYMAKALASHGHEVTFLTTRQERSFFTINKRKYNGVNIISFPDVIPGKLKSAGFGFISLFLKILHAIGNKYDLVVADCGHRPSGLPCIINRMAHNSLYFSEWWDYFGDEGYYKEKGFLFKLFYGKIETWAEIADKKNADGVIVLSTLMKDRALNHGVSNVEIIPGGSLVQELKRHNHGSLENKRINFVYLGMSNGEVNELEPFLKAIGRAEFKDKVRFVTYGSFLNETNLQKYNLSHVIDERGWIDYLESGDDLKDSDVFVQIRRDNVISRAGWPNKLGDYLALGRPILIYPYGDLNNFTKQYPAGFFVTQFDEEAIALKIHYILKRKKDFESMGLANRKVAEGISWEKRAADILKFYSATLC